MDNRFNFNRWIIGAILALMVVFSGASASEIQNRVGLEHTALNSQNVQQDTLKYKISSSTEIGKVSVQAYYREYKDNSVTSDFIEYTKFQLKPKFDSKYYFFYEGQYNFYNGDKEQKKYKTILGLYTKIYNIKTKAGYYFYDKIKDGKHSRKEGYVLILDGTLYKNSKHKVQFENYNYFNKEEKSGTSSLELQYKYRIIPEVDLYVYSVNEYHYFKDKDNQKGSRLDVGIYYYF